MITTILSLNGGLLTTILCIHNQYLVSIDSQIKLYVCLSVYWTCVLVLLLFLWQCLLDTQTLEYRFDTRLCQIDVKDR